MTDTTLIAFAKEGAPPDKPIAPKLARFVWARNRNAAGKGSDPMPVLIFEDVAVAHLEIVAEHVIEVSLTGPATMDFLTRLYPAPEVTCA